MIDERLSRLEHPEVVLKVRCAVHDKLRVQNAHRKLGHGPTRSVCNPADEVCEVFGHINSPEFER